MKAVTSRLLFLPCTISTLVPIHTLFNLGSVSSNFLSSSFFRKLFLHILHVFVTLPMLCPLFPLSFTAVQQPGILFFFLQDLCFPCPCCGLRDFLQKPSTTFRTLPSSTVTRHLRQLLLVPFLYLHFSLSLDHKGQCFVRSRLKVFHHLRLCDFPFETVTRNGTVISFPIHSPCGPFGRFFWCCCVHPIRLKPKTFFKISRTHVDITHYQPRVPGDQAEPHS